jgi:protein-tyrosine-phosphatase
MKVLFVCWANINRSQIAQVIFNRLSKKNRSTSAGIKPRKSGISVRAEHNNPYLPLRREGYDISHAKTKKVTKMMADSSDKIVLIFDRKHLRAIPLYLRNRPDMEFWEVGRISDEIPFVEYCRLEKKRIKLIERHVRDLVRRIG